MTNPNLTKIIAILDRSGSMQLVAEEARIGFDHYVKDQRDGSGECTLTLVQFNTVVEQVYVDKLINDVPPLDLRPDGMTALYDAVGTTVTKTGEQLAELDEQDRPGQVIVVILTDGLENSSRNWDSVQLEKLIKQQIDEWGWTFMYLGANQNAILEARKMGIGANMAATYDTANTVGTYAAASANTRRIREGDTSGFSDQEREAVK